MFFIRCQRFFFNVCMRDTQSAEQPGRGLKQEQSRVGAPVFSCTCACYVCANRLPVANFIKILESMQLQSSLYIYNWVNLLVLMRKK